jgi:hypothetical protein
MDLVRIASDINITVTKGLGAIDMTDTASVMSNKLNVKETWTKTSVDILKGSHDYPAEIQDWPTVKKLVELHKITIGQPTDETTATPEDVAAAKAAKDNIDSVEAEAKPKHKRGSDAPDPATEAPAADAAK